MIALSGGDWGAGIRPALGGSLTHLTWRGQDVLRPTPPDADDPLQTACFPLVPWTNRIAGGRFAFEGRGVELPPTPGFEPHALHGTGWRSAWSVADSGPASATLTLEQPRGDWPWAWRARQTVSLDEQGLTITLSVTNEDSGAMPAGLGLHPYFVRPPDGRLGFGATGVWTVDETLIPVALDAPDAVFDWQDGPRIETAPFIDHAYVGWDGTTRLFDAARTVTLTSPDARIQHVYVPRGEDYLCLEPVTHRPDVLNGPADEAGGMVILGPGETTTVTLLITCA